MKSSKSIRLLAAAAAITTCASVSPAWAQSPVKVGELDCSVSDSDKTLFSTHLVLACDFKNIDGSTIRSYQGTIDRKGISLGSIETGKFAWIVATLGEPENVKLDGTYLGAEAGVAVGTGLGGNYLTGGFNKKISLQPYSVEGKQGIGLELGGQSLVLTEIAN